eukprot:CAMPEP_0172512528 /NCGR_PEP_ID=MMETSP1066-20121228/245464_1 /TAXON_ID=671091 /ORGANISM="Coscinodiscus wailesii, Strain CCMP2513" /LENGTH=60 /DNA_ID=CAMNT_0013292401 /DNA_START=149 /DNA_END=331 /DNA_ORIENTATION=+
MTPSLVPRIWDFAVNDLGLHNEWNDYAILTPEKEVGKSLIMPFSPLTDFDKDQDNKDNLD